MPSGMESLVYAPRVPLELQRNSVFCAQLLRRLPHVPLQTPLQAVFAQVGEDVYEVTLGAQLPTFRQPHGNQGN